MPLPDPTADAIRRNPLPKAWVRDPRAMGVWINSVVPCVKAGVVQDDSVWKSVSDHLRAAGVSDADMGKAVTLSGQKFSFNVVTLSLRVPASGPRGVQPAPPSMGVAPQIDLAYLRQQSAYLDSRYIAAKAAANTHDMEAIAQMLIDLLRLAGDWKRTREAANEKAQNIQAEILRNARNVGGVVRVVGPRQMSPGPNGTTVRQVGENTYEYEIDPDALRLDEAEARGEEDADAE